MEILNGDPKEKERLELLREQRTKTILRYGKEWELDALDEDRRAEHGAIRDDWRAVLRCLCETCVEADYGKPFWRKLNGQDFFFAGSQAVQIAGSETVHHLWGREALCEACGGKHNLWAVDSRRSEARPGKAA